MSDTSLDLEVLTRTMARLGWHPVGSFRETVEYWELDSARRTFGAPDEIIVPIDPATSDFRSLLTRAERSLDALYGPQLRNIARMIEAMIKFDLDEVLLRRETPDLSGLIDWAGGNSMIQGARELLIASAKTTSKPRRRFANADTTIAEEFLSACRMGQTQIGSYIVTALTPTHGKFATSRSAKPGGKKGPVFEGRDITHTLVRALEASTAAILEAHSGAEPASFESYVPHGVSLELVRALRQVVSNEVESSVSVEIRHEDVLLDDARPTIREFAFTPSDSLVLTQAEKYFEESPAPRAAALSGEVILLKNSARGAEHQIKLRAIVNGAARTTTVTLTPEQYEEALRAHQDQVRLSIRGELELRSRSSVIEVADSVFVEKLPVARTKKAAPEVHEQPLFE